MKSIKLYCLTADSDVMSFYKEERAGENENLVSFFATSHGLSKLQALWKIADETAEAVQRATRVLSQDEDTLKAWISYRDGYVGFHAGSKRYRLSEIGL